MTLHFPDDVATNLLTINATDPKSGTAEFKACAVRVEPVRTKSLPLFAPRGAARRRRGRLMDLHLRHAVPTDDERAAVDALLGPPTSAWDGGSARRRLRRARRARWTRRLASNDICCCPRCRRCSRASDGSARRGSSTSASRLNVPPAEAWGVATFYALLSTTPRPRRVLHVCDDIACRCQGAAELIEQIEARSVRRTRTDRTAITFTSTPTPPSGCGLRVSDCATTRQRRFCRKPGRCRARKSSATCRSTKRARCFAAVNRRASRSLAGRARCGSTRSGPSR